MLYWRLGGLYDREYVAYDIRTLVGFFTSLDDHHQLYLEPLVVTKKVWLPAIFYITTNSNPLIKVYTLNPNWTKTHIFVPLSLVKFPVTACCNSFTSSRNMEINKTFSWGRGTTMPSKSLKLAIKRLSWCRIPAKHGS